MKTGELENCVVNLKLKAKTPASPVPTDEILESLAHDRSVFDNVNDAIFFHTLDGTFLQVNQAACQQLGYSQAELLSMKVQDLHRPEVAVRFSSSMERLLKEGNLLAERSHRRKDGSWMPVEINARLIRFKGQPAVLGVVRDISERKRAEAEIYEQNRRLAELALQANRRAKQLVAITELVHIVSSAKSLDDMFPVFADQVRQLVDYDRISIILFNPATCQMLIRLVIDESGRGPQQGMVMPCDESMLESLQRNPQPVVCPTPDGHERYPVGQGMANQMGVVTSMSLPLVIQDRFLGVLGISRRSEPFFEQSDMEMLLPVAKQLAIAVENARLAEQIQLMAIREERERLGHEMHDGLGQVLGSIAYRAATAVELLRRGQSEQARVAVEELGNIARTSYADVRQGILELRTSSSAALNVSDALREYLARFEREWSIECELIAPDGDVNSCRSKGEAQLLRIVQEAMTNVRKHAHAQHVVVHMECRGGSLITSVEDDGRGFDIGALNIDHFGLQTMQERAESVGGQLRVESAPGKGTRVVVTLPCGEI